MARILVVDDSPFMVRLVTYMLETAGYETASAENGRAALDLIARDPPDLVFLDMMMPEMDGLETLQAMRANPVTEGLPVLMLTAKAQAEDYRLAKEAGANGYLTKPFNQAEVLDSVVEHLGRAPKSSARRRGDEGCGQETAGGVEVVRCQTDLAPQDSRVGLSGRHGEDRGSGVSD
jgi:CheY-like chemotaxis protein